MKLALIYEDRLNAMLGKGGRFVVKMDGQPDAERKTFKAAQTIARQRGATHFVIRDDGFEILPHHTRHPLDKWKAPERGHCAHCQKVQRLEDYKGLPKSEDVKQCAVCGHIVDSERAQ